MRLTLNRVIKICNKYFGEDNVLQVYKPDGKKLLECNNEIYKLFVSVKKKRPS